VTLASGILLAFIEELFGKSSFPIFLEFLFKEKRQTSAKQIAHLWYILTQLVNNARRKE
jgi:hypothetical protein